MSNKEGEWGPRWSGPMESKVDYFLQDGRFQSERESLGGTEAAELVNSVVESITAEGVAYEHHCNCGWKQNVTVTWSEMGAIAYGILPSDPTLNITETRWLFDQPSQSFYPEIPCSKCTYEKRKLLIDREEAGRRLDSARKIGLDRNDPMMPRVYAFAQRLKQAAAANAQRGPIALGPGQRG